MSMVKQSSPVTVDTPTERAKNALFNIARTHGYRLNDVELSEAVRAVTRALGVAQASQEGYAPGEFNRFRVLCAVTAERICREHADPKAGYAVASAIRALPLPSTPRETLFGGTNFCGHGMMAVLCPTCSASSTDQGGK